jgi:hypothetical protein
MTDLKVAVKALVFLSSLEIFTIPFVECLVWQIHSYSGHDPALGILSALVASICS